MNSDVWINIGLCVVLICMICFVGFMGWYLIEHLNSEREYCISECNKYNAMAITNGSEWRCVC